MLTVITGGIHSGKTTKALEIVKAYPRCRGFLSRAVIKNGIHEGYDLYVVENKTTMPFIRKSAYADRNKQAAYRLDTYIFYRDAFETAESMLYSIEDTDTAVLDEMGILECRKEGFYRAAKELLSRDIHLITCIREQCLRPLLELLNPGEVDLIQV